MHKEFTVFSSDVGGKWISGMGEGFPQKIAASEIIFLHSEMEVGLVFYTSSANILSE